jgi:hypothetical protein
VNTGTAPHGVPQADNAGENEIHFRGKQGQKGIGVLYVTGWSKLTPEEQESIRVFGKQMDIEASSGGITRQKVDATSRKVANRVAQISRELLGLGRGSAGGHLPDVAAGQDPIAPVTGMPSRVNASFGGQWKRYEHGFTFTGVSIYDADTGQWVYDSLALEHSPPPAPKGSPPRAEGKGASPTSAKAKAPAKTAATKSNIRQVTTAAKQTTPTGAEPAKSETQTTSTRPELTTQEAKKTPTISGPATQETQTPGKPEPAKPETQTTTTKADPGAKLPVQSKVSTQQAKNKDFQTKGEVKYTEGFEAPQTSMGAPNTGGTSALIGEGLANILPEAMSAFQDKNIQHAVAREMLRQWSTVEKYRKDYPNDWILCVVSLEEWAQPDAAGQVARLVNYVRFFHGATQQDAQAEANSVFQEGVPMRWREVGPFLGWIHPADPLSDIKKEVESHKWCFIATVCYNSPLAPEVCLLREFRDVVLRRSRRGRAFIRAYYLVSPPIAVFLERHAWPRALVRNLVLQPLIALVRRSSRSRAAIVRRSVCASYPSKTITGQQQ